MFNTPYRKRRPRRQLLWSMLFATVMLVGTFGFFSAQAGTAHAAAVTSPHPFPSIGKANNSTGYHPTATDKALATDKEQLSKEYNQRVLSGQEPLAIFETHYRAFMLKWHLGNVSNLHSVLTRGAARIQSTAGKLTVPSCVNVVSGASTLCQATPVGAAQFPEESFNWCGPATLATTVVENSFAWSGANTYNGVTMSYNPYAVTQSSGTATSDELWLAQNGVIEPSSNPNWVYQDGTDVTRLLTVLNHFTNGHGGNYAEEPLAGSLQSQIADFQGKVASDIGTGWDVPTGIYIAAHSGASMPGYPVNYPYEIDHLVPVTFISSDHNTIYYSDPIYGAPAYSNWSVPAPYESTSASNIVWWAGYILW